MTRFFATYGPAVIVNRDEFDSATSVREECDRFFPQLPVAVWEEDEDGALTILHTRNPRGEWAFTPQNVMRKKEKQTTDKRS